MSRLRLAAQRSPEGDTLHVFGELDLETGPQLLGEAKEHLAAGEGMVRLDMAQVTFIDSSGIKALVNLCNHIDGLGRSAVIARPAPMVRRILEVLGVDALAPFETGEG